MVHSFVRAFVGRGNTSAHARPHARTMLVVMLVAGWTYTYPGRPRARAPCRSGLVDGMSIVMRMSVFDREHCRKGGALIGFLFPMCK